MHGISMSTVYLCVHVCMCGVCVCGVCVWCACVCVCMCTLRVGGRNVQDTKGA